jgi:DNA (cytosine-5)-methyltransferase 1
MKVLNLYACLGGNRFKWTDCQVTAIELDHELARLYRLRFPQDTVIIADAHQYLLDHYNEFDFIWSSPPCPTHSRARFANNKAEPCYPDMKLYEEILFLENYFDGKYCVENVIPFYEPLIPAQKRGRHLYWTNFKLPSDLGERKTGNFMESIDEVKKWCEFHEYDFYQYKGKQRTDKIARNLVDYEAGLTVYECAKGSFKPNYLNQTILNL